MSMIMFVSRVCAI